MILAAVALLIAVLAVAFIVARFRLPAFVALSGVALAYGFATDRSANAIGRAFGQGFATALEEAGLLLVAGALAAAILGSRPVPRLAAVMAGAAAGVGGSAAGGLALLQPAVDGAPRRAAILAIVLLVTHGLLLPSPLASAAASVLDADFRDMLVVALPAMLIALAAGAALVLRTLRSDAVRGSLGIGLLAVVVPIALLVVQSVAQIPSEPLGRGAARDLYTALARPLMLAVLAVALALVLSARWRPEAFAVTSWALPLLAVGAAGGFSRVLDSTGMAELLAERVIDARLGLFAPFLAAVVVKTLQGNSLTAVLTASGMVEPLLPALGLDTGQGRALAAAAVGAGSIGFCHINDPFFWIAAHMAQLSPARALRTITLGSGVAALAAFDVLLILSWM